MSGPDEDAIQYVLLETHYDNINERDDIIDRSGMGFHYTSELREHSAGVIQIGMIVSPWSQFIPPGISEITNLGCMYLCIYVFILIVLYKIQMIIQNI